MNNLQTKSSPAATITREHDEVEYGVTESQKMLRSLAAIEENLADLSAGFKGLTDRVLRDENADPDPNMTVLQVDGHSGFVPDFYNRVQAIEYFTDMLKRRYHTLRGFI